MTDSYAWSPRGKELLSLEISLKQIFVIKGLYWLIIFNMITFSVLKFLKKKYKVSLIVLLIITTGYYSTIRQINKTLAFDYFAIFLNQSVAEGYLTEPIINGGYYVGEYLIKDLKNKSWIMRRYAINGIISIKYYPAIPILQSILNDSTDNEIIRADAYQALVELKKDESVKIATDFKNNAKSVQDKRIIELGEYFIRSH